MKQLLLALILLATVFHQPAIGLDGRYRICQSSSIQFPFLPSARKGSWTSDVDFHFTCNEFADNLVWDITTHFAGDRAVMEIDEVDGFFYAGIEAKIPEKGNHRPKNYGRTGQIIRETIPAPSLTNGLLNPPTRQPVIIYLPPSYNRSKKNYPVVYFLPGFTSPIEEYITGVYQGFDWKNSMDSLIFRGKIKEMIVVLPNGGNFLGGSFYVNSPVTGNWEDFIVKDVIGHIDSRYRTIPEAVSRAICGNSMGGFGALNIAMKHPDIYKLVYSLSPALFDENGLSEHGMLSGSEKIERFLAKERELAQLPDAQAKQQYRSFIRSLYSAHSISEYYRAFSYAYGSAFSPNKDKKTPYIDYPFRKSGEKVILDSAILKNYEDGFGGWATKINRYRENFRKLHLMVIDYGCNDKARWIPGGCRHVSGLLEAANISHRVLTYQGGHNDHLRDRIENHMLPAFSAHLHFESGTGK